MKGAVVKLLKNVDPLMVGLLILFFLEFGGIHKQLDRIERGIRFGKWE